MIVIQHRCNEIRQVQATSHNLGIEIDLRNHGKEILVTHDPFVGDAPTLDEWLQHYDHRFLIANVKEEGMEPRLTEILSHHKIEEFFILDESFPFIRKYALEGLSKFALRISEFEDHRTALNLARFLHRRDRKVDWIWVDSFEGNVLSPAIAEELRDEGFKLCLVSPELHHVSDPTSWEGRIVAYRNQMTEIGLSISQIDMVCTKVPDLWS
jgi:hypothetical protein